MLPACINLHVSSNISLILPSSRDIITAAKSTVGKASSKSQDVTCFQVSWPWKYPWQTDGSHSCASPFSRPWQGEVGDSGPRPLLTFHLRELEELSLKAGESPLLVGNQRDEHDVLGGEEGQVVGRGVIPTEPRK